MTVDKFCDEKHSTAAKRNPAHPKDISENFQVGKYQVQKFVMAENEWLHN
jgi:hypothetical protein